jgi:RNase P subunit RPR2
MKMLIKGCKRCGGTLVGQRVDPETVSVTCLQCGAERDVSLGSTWPTTYSRVLKARIEANAAKGAAA